MGHEAEGRSGDGDLPHVEPDMKQWMHCLTGLQLEILLVLSEGPACVGDLTERLKLDYSSMSRSLGALRALGCVQDERNGRRSQYHLCRSVGFERDNGEVILTLNMPRNRRVILILPAPSKST